MYGPTGIIVGVAAGLLRVLHITAENTAELVPVDYCVNSLLTSAFDIAQNTYNEPPIYNFVTSNKNPITWQQYTDYASVHGERVPLMKSAWYYAFTMSSSKTLVTFLTFFYHFLPAALIDLGLFICGKKPK
jgi:alcohol-forming fatty acyl-CoA reductase